MATVTFADTTCVYPGATAPAVDKLNLNIEDGEFVVLVGPSGCGKTTSLRMLAGLEEVNDGSIFIGDREVTWLPAKKRDIAMVFQNYALYPHMTVAENMGFALRISGVGKAEVGTRVREAARILDIEQYLGRKPKTLSGGQRQRVAMGRAIVRNPQVFLMDEPLSNLDAMLRVQTRTEIASLQRRLGVTTVYVTHDQTEAMTMGDRVAVLKDGVLQQFGTPLELYDSPSNRFVGGFIGSPAMNLITAQLTEGGAVVGSQVDQPTLVPLAPQVSAAAASGGAGLVTLGFRPENLRITEGDGIPFEVDVIEELGADAYVYGHVVAADGSSKDTIVVRVGGHHRATKGETVRLAVLPEHVHAFHSVTGERLGTT